MSSYFRDLVAHRIEIAKQLYRGKCVGSYAEAVIILCSVISGIASRLWPGENIDRRRFVELIARFSDISLKAGFVSLPIMYQSLDSERSPKTVEALQDSFPQLRDWNTKVLSGDDIDKPELKIIQAIKNISKKEVREYSYANILYKQIRCGYFHEYKLGKLATPHPMTRSRAGISYSNMLLENSRDIIHQIHFPFDWIEDVTRSIAKAVEGKINNDEPLKRPESWWIDG